MYCVFLVKCFLWSRHNGEFASLDVDVFFCFSRYPSMYVCQTTAVSHVNLRSNEGVFSSHRPPRLL